MRKGYKKVALILLIALVITFQSLTVFAATATVTDYTLDTDYWWNGWEDYSYYVVNKTISYSTDYTVLNTTSSTREWWDSQVLFRETKTTYFWKTW